MSSEEGIMPLYHPLLEFEKVVRLPEYGYIGLTKVEIEIIDTWEVQRLRRIRQTPGASFVYPGANHSRFEHSLGVMYLAGEAALHVALNSFYDEKPLPKLSKKAQKELKEDIQKVRIAGLLHDVGHGPFSHTYELFHEMIGIESYHHEDYSREIMIELLPNICKKYGIDWRHILAIYTEYNKMEELFNFYYEKCGLSECDLREIEKFLNEKLYLNLILLDKIHNVDRMNYLVLDSNRTGAIEYGMIDVSRIIQNLYFVNNSLHLSIKAEGAFLRFLEAYCYMYSFVYLHDVARAADVHLALLLSHSWEELERKGIRIKQPSKEELLRLYDDGLLKCIEMHVSNQLGRELFDMFLRRDILRKATDLPFGGFITSWLEESERIREDLKLPQILLLYPSTLSPPAPFPSNPRDLARYQFFDPSGKKLMEEVPSEFLQRVQVLTYPQERIIVYAPKKYRAIVRKKFESKK